MPHDFIIYIVIGAVFGILGFVVQNRLRSKFAHYSQVPVPGGRTGADIARKMLRDHGINDVEVVSVAGFLSDHYNPANKTVNLSPDVYNGQSVAAAAVAAHECGHAVQHATAYSMLTFRSKMVPVVQIAASAQQFLMFFMIGGATYFSNSAFLLVVVILFGITTLFSLVTLPVEFDASRRALAWLKSSNTTLGIEYDGAYDALKWAAMTYVVAALSALATFMFFLLKLLAASDRD